MNWDRVRWETRAARNGSEWAGSGDFGPQFAATDRFGQSDARSMEPKARPSKKKKKKKRKTAKGNVQMQLKGTVAANSKPNVSAFAITQQSSRMLSGAQKRIPASATAEKSPVLIPHSNSNGLGKAQRTSAPLSLPELQKLTIRLYKALGENRMLEAASLASDIRCETLRYSEQDKQVQ